MQSEISMKLSPCPKLKKNGRGKFRRWKVRSNLRKMRSMILTLKTRLSNPRFRASLRNSLWQSKTLTLQLRSSSKPKTNASTRRSKSKSSRGRSCLLRKRRSFARKRQMNSSRSWSLKRNSSTHSLLS